jgi:hypothetical protein
LVHEEARPERVLRQPGEHAGRAVEGHSLGRGHDEARGRLEGLVTQLIFNGGSPNLRRLVPGALTLRGPYVSIVPTAGTRGPTDAKYQCTKEH